MNSLLQENSNKIIFSIKTEDLQAQAMEYIDRELKEEEIKIAQKALENGINTSLDIIYSTIFNEILKK